MALSNAVSYRVSLYAYSAQLARLAFDELSIIHVAVSLIGRDAGIS